MMYKISKYIISSLLITTSVSSISLFAQTVFKQSTENPYYLDMSVSSYNLSRTKKAKPFTYNRDYNSGYYSNKPVKIFRNENASIDLKLGRRFGDFGFEAGAAIMVPQQTKANVYQSTLNGFAIVKNKIEEYKITTQNYNYNLDFKYYYKIFNNVELITTAGAGVLNTQTKGGDVMHKLEGAPIIKKSVTGVSPRGGLGLQANLTKGLKTNFNFMFQGGNKYYSSVNAINFGMSYNI